MKQKEPKERQRKEYRWGSITQKMMSFKIDLDLLERLQLEPNKGRLINNLLRRHFGLEEPQPDHDDDENPVDHDLEEYMT